MRIAPLLIQGSCLSGRHTRNAQMLAQRSEFVPDRALVCALNTHIGRSDWAVTLFEDGWGSCVYAAQRSGGEPVVVKVGVFSDTHTPAEEFAFSLLMLQNDNRLPFAVPYLLDTSGEIIGYPYVVMARLPGSSLLSQYESGTGPEATRALGKVAQSMARMHAAAAQLRCSGFGPLVLDELEGIVQGQSPTTFQGIYSDQDMYYRYGFEKWLKTAGFRDLVSFADWEVLKEACHGALPNVLTRGLIHGDPSLRNFLFQGESLVGIIDGSGRAGWLEEDVAAACVFIWQHAEWIVDVSRTELVNRFIESYVACSSRPVDLDSIRLLSLRKLASRIRTCLAIGAPSDASVTASMIPAISSSFGNSETFVSSVVP